MSQKSDQIFFFRFFLSNILNGTTIPKLLVWKILKSDDFEIWAKIAIEQNFRQIPTNAYERKTNKKIYNILKNF